MSEPVSCRMGPYGIEIWHLVECGVQTRVHFQAHGAPNERTSHSTRCQISIPYGPILHDTGSDIKF